MTETSSPTSVLDAPELGEGVQFHSYSSLNTFATICALQYRYRYIDRLPQEQVAAPLVFGSAVNDALRTIDLDLQNGRKVDVPGALQTLRSYLEKSFANRFLPVVSTKDEGLEELYEKGKVMIEHYCSILPQEEQPLDKPRRFTIPLIDENGEALPRPLVGELDRWVMTSDGKIGVVDWKTAQARWSQDKIAKDDQATAYLLAGEQILGKRPAFFRYDLLLKTKKPEVERYYVVRLDRHFRRFRKKVKELDKALQSGAFVPNDQSFACPTCPFKGRCERWQD